MLPHRVIDWQVKEFSEIKEATILPHIYPYVDIDLLLIGCGTRMWQIRNSLKESLGEFGIVIEAMSTGAAVRTYNILLGEKRRVAAALISVE